MEPRNIFDWGKAKHMLHAVLAKLGFERFTLAFISSFLVVRENEGPIKHIIYVTNSLSGLAQYYSNKYESREFWTNQAFGFQPQT